MRKAIIITVAFVIMAAIMVVPCFATDEGAPEDTQIVAHGPRSERMLSLLAGYEANLVAGETRFTLSDTIRYVFSDVLPGWASVAVWIGDRIQPDLFVYLCAMVVIYSIVGGYRHVNRD